ncbi:MAG: transposase, partial [Microvirga sp.]|nr:transposase [Microvirga sp.]
MKATRCSSVRSRMVLNEMWHYLGAKANKLWIWTALDRAA